MVTRLGQGRVKGSSPAYESLKDELVARSFGDGSGYSVPAGGIPRSDMTIDVQNAINRAELSYVKEAMGIPITDFTQAVRSQLALAQSAYQKPGTGIPLLDLETSVQTILSNVENAYLMPSTGIPYVDFDFNVKEQLGKAVSAYQKPAAGIPSEDLAEGVIASLVKANTAYQRPETGIPLHHLETQVPTFDEFSEHKNDTSQHITDHKNLTSVGRYTHEELDIAVDEYGFDLNEINRELRYARGDFATIGTRIDTLLGRNSYYVIDTEEEWNEGTMTNLKSNEEGNISFSFTPEMPVIDVYNITEHMSLIDENRIGVLTFDQGTLMNKGTGNWIDNLNKNTYTGMKLEMFVYAPRTGKYNFSLQFSGRTRMQVAGKLLFDTQGTVSHTGDAGTTIGEIDLIGGKLYPVVIEGWYLVSGSKILQVMWQPPAQNGFTWIPSSYMNQSGYEVDEGIYETNTIDLRDDSINTWYLEIETEKYRVDDTVTAEVATSEDGVLFTEWVPFSLIERIPAAPKRYAKFRLTVTKDLEESTPLLHRLKIRYLSSAMNELRDEIMEARDIFDTLKGRFDNIDQRLLNVTSYEEILQNSNVHPEQFASVRLLQIELALLKRFILDAETKSTYLPIEGGIVDLFKTDDFIDKNNSDVFELIGESIKVQRGLRRLNESDQWLDGKLDRMDTVDNTLKLGLYQALVDPDIMTVLDNSYSWSSNTDGLINVNYQSYLAQPFYTGDDVNVINNITVYVQSYSEHWTGGDLGDGFYIHLCRTKKESDEPDLEEKVATYNMGAGRGTVSTGTIRIPVLPRHKYWIVIERIARGYNGSRYFFLTPDNTTTNIRLRSDNPASQSLRMKKAASLTSPTWGTTANYLRFKVDEGILYEPEGSAEYIFDYSKTTSFVSANITATVPGDSILSTTFQTSDNYVMWSEETANIENVPPGRFLKMTVRMQKGLITHQSPTLRQVEIYHYAINGIVMSKKVTLNQVPTHVIFTAEESDESAVRYFVSRNDGTDWTEITKNTYTPLSMLQPGNELRVKAEIDGTKTETQLHQWAFTGITYRDVTGQNITALYEEYIAEEGQDTFELGSEYPMGNHSLQVFLNGIRQSIEKDYIEVSNRMIRFNEPLVGGLDPDRVTFVVASGAYDMHDASLLGRIGELESMIQEERIDHRKRHTYNLEGQLIKTEFLDTPEYYAIEYEYLPDGAKQYETVTKGTKTKRTTYIYDEQGRISDEIVTFSEVTN